MNRFSGRLSSGPKIIGTYLKVFGIVIVFLGLTIMNSTKIMGNTTGLLNSDPGMQLNEKTPFVNNDYTFFWRPIDGVYEQADEQQDNPWGLVWDEDHNGEEDEDNCNYANGTDFYGTSYVSDKGAFMIGSYDAGNEVTVTLKHGHLLTDLFFNGDPAAGVDAYPQCNMELTLQQPTDGVRECYWKTMAMLDCFQCWGSVFEGPCGEIRLFLPGEVMCIERLADDGTHPGNCVLPKYDCWSAIPDGVDGWAQEGDFARVHLMASCDPDMCANRIEVHFMEDVFSCIGNGNNDEDVKTVGPYPEREPYSPWIERADDVVLWSGTLGQFQGRILYTTTDLRLYGGTVEVKGTGRLTVQTSTCTDAYRDMDCNGIADMGDDWNGQDWDNVGHGIDTMWFTSELSCDAIWSFYGSEFFGFINRDLMMASYEDDNHITIRDMTADSLTMDSNGDGINDNDGRGNTATHGAIPIQGKMITYNGQSYPLDRTRYNGDDSFDITLDAWENWMHAANYVNYAYGEDDGGYTLNANQWGLQIGNFCDNPAYYGPMMSDTELEWKNIPKALAALNSPKALQATDSNNFESDWVYIKADHPITLVGGLWDNNQHGQVYGQLGMRYYLPVQRAVAISGIDKTAHVNVKWDDAPTENTYLTIEPGKQVTLKTLRSQSHSHNHVAGARWVRLVADEPIKVDLWVAADDNSFDTTTVASFKTGGDYYPADDKWSVPLHHCCVVYITALENDTSVGWTGEWLEGDTTGCVLSAYETYRVIYDENECYNDRGQDDVMMDNRDEMCAAVRMMHINADRDVLVQVDYISDYSCEPQDLDLVLSTSPTFSTANSQGPWMLPMIMAGVLATDIGVVWAGGNGLIAAEWPFRKKR
jgi:hypothetical protein